MHHENIMFSSRGWLVMRSRRSGR
ncbi:hypothetical protein [Escherichia coli]